jgi:hypothetical protein
MQASMDGDGARMTTVCPGWLVKLRADGMIMTEALHAKKLAEKKIGGS